MKSGRKSALTKTNKAKSRNVTLPKEAMKLLTRLEYARNYKDKTRYNNILNKLTAEYPEMSEQILQLKFK
jgi:hypothetical protein